MKESPTLVDIWKRFDECEQRLSKPLSARMLDLAGLQPGMKVLDIATGRGEPAIPAAQRVAPSGFVVGVDIDADMLDMTRARAQLEGVENLSLHTGNAESLAGIDAFSFDVCLARWGLMYMDRPMDALRAIHHALKPGGCLVAACWAEPERVSYYSLPRAALALHMEVTPPDLYAPGTFAYSSCERIQGDFQEAGFEIASIEDFELDVMEATSEQDLIDWCLCFGMNRLLKDASLEMQTAWERDLIRLAQAQRHQGCYRLGGVTRVIHALRN